MKSLPKLHLNMLQMSLLRNVYFMLSICLVFSIPIHAQTITSVNPNNGQLGQQLRVFIGGNNVNFLNGSSSIQTNFIQGSTSIPAPPINVNPAGDVLEVSLDLSNTSYPSGFYDLSMNTPAHGMLSFSNAFRIDTTALKSTIPQVAFRGQSINVLLVGQAIDFNTISIPPIYWRGLDTITTSIVQTRGTDTLELQVNLGAAGIRDGNYDLELTTPGGPLFLRNALEVRSTNISGTIYHDPNMNNMRDSAEIGIGSIRLLLLPDGKITSSSSFNGAYRFNDIAAGTYQVVILPDAGIQSTAPSDTQTVVVNSLNAFDASFGVVSNLPDNIDVYSRAGRARCGQNVGYWMQVRNKGLTPVDGVQYFVKDTAISYSASTISAADSVKGDTAFFSFNNLERFRSNYISIMCDLPGITVLPVGASIIGKTGAFLVDAMNNPIPSTDTTHNNSTIVRCSYDPNDKLVNPVGLDTNGFILHNTMLEYTIRFQNTGNDTAYRVVIIDTLSPNLSFFSFQFVEASHSVVTEIDANGIIQFTFDNIFLVDSATNEPASNGFVTFRISPNAGLIDSTVVRNRAAIYFDFNPPIITNYTTNTYVSTLITSIEELDRGIAAILAPNPTSGLVHIQLEQSLSNGRLSVFSLDGKRLYLEQQLNTALIPLDLTAYPDGVYLIRLEDGDRLYSHKVIVQH